MFTESKGCSNNKIATKQYDKWMTMKADNRTQGVKIKAE